MTLGRRAFVGRGLAAAGALALGRRLRLPRLTTAGRPLPSPAQLAWQRDELAMFVHFGVNTFTDREWGDGREDPNVFAPTRLDTRQWARAAKRAGFRAMVLTAKHHDGFCLWPTRTTTHSVASSTWRGGAGDVVREFVDACAAERLKAGLYLSPWDRNHPAYGDSPRYNDVYCAQLTELLTGYGPISEVWFDGANGEGPNGRKQQYDWPRFWGLVKKLQPDAVIFSDAGPDVRWCGNERGEAGDPNWATIDPGAVPYPGYDAPSVTAALQHGDPAGSVWRPAEVDVSIRPGWFNHAAEDAKVRTPDDLVALYLSSVGRNGKLLLNVPPTRDGVLADADVASLAGFRDRLDASFAHDLAAGARREWRVTGARAATLALDLARPATVGVVWLGEDIARGQRVSGYVVNGAGVDGVWRELSRGTTIGYAKIDRAAPALVRRVRVTVETVDEPVPVEARLFAAG